MNTQPFAIAVIIIVILNFFLFVFGYVSSLVFWSIVIVSAIIAWKVLPKLKEEL